MLDRHIVPIHERLLVLPARILARWGVSANQLTIAGFIVGLGAVPALANGQFTLALALIGLNRLADGLDGAVARLSAPTARGAYLDIALDFFFYAAIPFGFALADPQTNGLPAAFVLLSFVGTGSSFLAFAALAAQRGLHSDALPNKGIFYLGGLTEGTETVVFFILICLMPQHFAILAYIFGVMALITTLTRWAAGWQRFGGTAPSGAPRPAPQPSE